MNDAWRQPVKEGKITKELVTTLFDLYIKDPHFNQWYVSMGGLSGNDPTQQSTERAMEKVKGIESLQGMLNIERNMGTMIEVELLKMIVNVSTTCMGVENHTFLQEEKVVLQIDYIIYKQLSLYYNSITESIDTRTIHEDDTDKYEYFINTEDSVGKFITDGSISDYYEALKGRTKKLNNHDRSFVNVCLR